MARYIWKGPPTVIEIWQADPARPEQAKSVFAGFVATGAPIPAEIDATTEQAAGWLAFGLIEPAPEADLTPAAGEAKTDTKARARKEDSNG
jgi:hypothetical protein